MRVAWRGSEFGLVGTNIRMIAGRGQMGERPGEVGRASLLKTRGPHVNLNYNCFLLVILPVGLLQSSILFPRIMANLLPRLVSLPCPNLNQNRLPAFPILSHLVISPCSISLLASDTPILFVWLAYAIGKDSAPSHSGSSNFLLPIKLAQSQTWFLG